MKLLLFLSFIFFTLAVLPGGPTEPSEPTPFIESLAAEIKPQLIAEIHQRQKLSSAEPFEVVSYSSQVVAGMNFFLKIRIGEEYFHVRIFQPLPFTGESASVVKFKQATLGETLTSF